MCSIAKYVCVFCLAVPWVRMACFCCVQIVSVEEDSSAVEAQV